jgi:hypothetical protein
MTQETDMKTVQVGQNISDEERAQMDAAMAALDQAIPPQQEEENKETAGPCVRCGHDPSGENKPNDEDVQEYARAILGSRQFTKTYKLMGGQIQFTFTTLNGVESEHLNNCTIGLNQISDPLRYNALALKYRMMFMLKEYSIGGKKTEVPVPGAGTLDPGDYDGIDALFSEHIEHLDAGLVQMVAQSLMLFRSLESALISGAFDETFWTGAGPC